LSRTLYVDGNNINYEETAIVFPATAKTREIELLNDNRRFGGKANLFDNKYLIYSNIGNCDDETIDTLKT
jgi:hypothetical protein